MTLHPYKPVPWESFTLIKTPRTRRARPHILLILAALAIVSGALVAVSQW